MAGGFRGIGLELTKLLLKDGARVFVIGRSHEKCEEARVVLASFEERISFFIGDLSQSKNLLAAHQKAKDWSGGRVHHLAVFLGSGKTPFGYEFPLDQWRQVFETNAFAPIGVVQSFLPLLFHGEGNPSITLTGAIAGVERARAPMTYAVAKTALIAYASHLAAGLIEKGIRVNAVSPGNVFFKGGRWEEILSERPDEIRVFLDQSVGMKRLGTAEELAWVYFSIMSPKNSFMTGQNIISDGLQVHKIL